AMSLVPNEESVEQTPTETMTAVSEKPAPLKIVPKTSAETAASAGGGNSSNGGGANKAAGKNATSAIKVDTGRVDSVLDAVGELVVLKNQLVHDETVRSGVNLRLEAIVDQLDKAVRELYEKTLSIRMTPLKSMFIKIQRIVRDVSLTLDKPVDLQLIGEETEVERTVFELLGDPLVHLVRNSMDHGIEKKEIRQQRNKPATAKVTVSAKQNGGNVIIEICDDGGGINREKVLGKAIERGLVPSNVDPASIPDETVFQYIFQPGFSTADKISDLSGRGVGLDVVKSNLDKINGKINISSKAGVGTTFRLTIPLSTAITDGIIVALDGARYILPIHSIREIVRVQPKDYTNISKAGRVASIRGHLLPVIDVSKTLGTINWTLNKKDQQLVQRRENSLSARREETMLVIIESMTGQMAFPVDDVLGQAQVVVKPINTGHNIPEVAGAAILGDGRTVLILEPGSLVTNSYKAQEMAS
ncbi:MAG TPA: chemotaxis protein CheA, partial [Bdellovibrio sp.]|nr:chemotaxis protein CheA [Bdellovibrio sp.]